MKIIDLIRIPLTLALGVAVIVMTPRSCSKGLDNQDAMNAKYAAMQFGGSNA